MDHDGAAVNAAVQTQVVHQTNSRFRSGTEIDETGGAQSQKVDLEVRQIRKVEKEMHRCVNLEKLFNKPIDELQDVLLDLPAEEDLSADQHEEEFRFKPKRCGIMSLGTAEIAELYKDHLCYEFPATELQELLGEDGMAVKDSSRRYFLKFTGLQIVNVDCKSGIVNDL